MGNFPTPLSPSLLQTVMTSVYGVTFIGAREQIASRLRERGFPWQDWAELCKLSTYAAQVSRFPAKPLRGPPPSCVK